MNRLPHLLTALVGLSLLPSPALAQTCEPAPLQTQLQYLRRLSLDLRGRLPDVQELESVVTNEQVDPAIVDAMLESPDFLHQMRTHHRDLLWTNVTSQRLSNVAWDLRPFGRGAQAIWYVRNRALNYRGGQVPCLDEPARFDPSTNEILTTADAADPRVQREGYVQVQPYWAPATTIKVCAFDAQDQLEALNPRGGAPVSCDRSPVATCGCGPNLQWCQAQSAGTQRRITESMNEQLMRAIDGVIQGDRPYSDLILAKDAQINGPLAHWLRHQSQTGGNVLLSAPIQNHPIPELSYEAATTWQSVQRQTRHAGVLTMPAYLLKFASNRGRAHRFYNAFLCQDFESNEPIPPSTDTCHLQSDLTKRCGCKGCHLALEPAAAHWGRWAEAGLLPLNEDLFPRYSPNCADPRRAESAICRLFYFTANDVADPAVDSAYIGQLKAYVYADTTREMNIEAGPEHIAQQAVDTGAFAKCTAQRMWQLLLARAPSEAEAELMDTLATEFQGSGAHLKDLVRTIVTRPEYMQADLPMGDN